MVDKETNRLILKLQSAVAAAEDRLSELVSNPDNDGTILLLRSAFLEVEKYFPPSNYISKKGLDNVA